MDLAAFSDDARYFGATRAALRAAYYRANRLCGFRVYRFLVLEPADVNRELLTRAVPFDCRILTDEEVAVLTRNPEDAAVIGTPRPGSQCFGIFDGATLANAGWFTSQPTHLQHRLMASFDPRWVYRYGGFTRSRYRGLNLHGIGLARATEAFCARGYAGSVGAVERANFASLKSCYRTGFRDCGTAVVVHVRGRTFIRQTRGASRYGLRLTAITAPETAEPPSPRSSAPL